VAGEFIFPRVSARAVEFGAARVPFTIGFNQLGLPMYSPQVLDHFQNPRNTGEIQDADGAAEIENPACGDVLRLTLKTSAGRITLIRFKAKGCVAAIACASALTELVMGKTLTEAQHLQREDISNAVGGLPAGSTHAAQLAVDALSAALNHFRV
jgi:nitrogen fixation NifU-like protein